MKRVALSLLLITLPLARAQTWPDYFSQFNGYINQMCETGQNIGVLNTQNIGDAAEHARNAARWLCSARPSILRATNLMTSLLTDADAFLSHALTETYSLVADATGWQIGGFDLGSAVQEAMRAVQDGDGLNFRALAGELVSRANRERLAELMGEPPAGVSDDEKELHNSARRDPSFVAGQYAAGERRRQAAMRGAGSQDTAQESRNMAAGSLARGDEERLLNNVTNPNPATPGTADQAENDGVNASSTRAAVQTMITQHANWMRQSALEATNIITAVKEQSVQTSLTVQQLSTLVQTISEQHLRDYEAWESEYYDELAAESARGREFSANFNALADFLESPGGN